MLLETSRLARLQRASAEQWLRSTSGSGCLAGLLFGMTNGVAKGCAVEHSDCGIEPAPGEAAAGGRGRPA